MADIEETVQAAKAFLLKSENGEASTYDHMVNVLKTILTQRPDDVLNNFENISRSAKSDAFKGDNDRLQPDDVKSDAFEVSTKQKPLFLKGEEEEIEDIYEGECVLPNILELANHFEETGINLGRDETFRIYLALKKLTEQYPLATCRFWGKIQGTKANYIVAQATFREGTDEPEDEDEAAEEEEEENHEGEEEDKEDALPVSNWKPPMVIPTEDRGAGSNKYVFFVCNRPGDEWVRLPEVTPTQIGLARKIRKMFTGELTTKICSYPPFPGDESNYLRAQIARISAGTHISPLGYYQFDEEDEGEEEDEEGKTDFIENPEFEGIPVRDLADPSLANWVHHVLHILPQGRTSWYNTNQKTEDAEEEEEEEVEVQDEAEPEIGPSLLTSISEDVEVDNMPAWTARISSNIIHPNHSLAVLKSNLWCGATTFCNGKRFENIYIGWGQKYIADNYSPPAPPKFEQEFIVGAEVTEIEDPTVEEEQAFKKAQEEELMAAEEMEEEDDDEDDDA